MIRLSARSLKCTLVLNAAELAAQADPVGARVVLAVEVAGRTVTADINPCARPRPQ
jgi:hypothetical protein